MDTLTPQVPSRHMLPIPARRHPLIANVARALRTRCAVTEDRPMVVGVSGGADSVALLFALVELRDRGARSGGLAVVHVNHHLRGESSDVDAAWVLSLSERLNLDCEVVDVQLPAESGNTEAAARDLRYAALSNAAANRGAGIVAVAHHADDQFETMLMHLSRGAGPGGLAGMRYRRALEAGVDLVRPLLNSTRDDCKSLCAAAEIDWRIDATNMDLSRRRAAVRARVTPVLESLWPGAAGRTAGSADLLRAAFDALERECDATLGPPEMRQWPRAVLREIDPVIVAAGLRRCVLDAAPACPDAVPLKHLRDIAEAIGDDEPRPRDYHLPQGWLIRVTNTTVDLLKDALDGE